MADSKRLDVLKRLTALLETITDFDLTDKVYRGRTRIADETQMPCLVIFEQPPELGIPASSETSLQEWTLGIQGFIKPDIKHPTDKAHDLLVAVKAKLYEVMNMGGGGSPPPDFMLDNTIEGLEIDGGMCFAPDESTNGCFFGLKLVIKLAEDLGDLYVN